MTSLQEGTQVLVIHIRRNHPAQRFNGGEKALNTRDIDRYLKRGPRYGKLFPKQIVMSNLSTIQTRKQNIKIEKETKYSSIHHAIKMC